MPGQRFPMRKIRDVLRLNAGGLSKRKIAVSLGIGATAAGDCIRRARQAGLAWPLPDDLGDEALEARLFPASSALAAIKARRPEPDWPAVHRELRRKGVTLQLLWEEHRAANPGSREGTARHARVPPIDYRDGILPRLTNPRKTDINVLLR